MSDGKVWLTWLEGQVNGDRKHFAMALSDERDESLGEAAWATQLKVLSELWQFLRQDSVKIGDAVRYLL